jgi:predicted transcriptional regulator
MSIRQRRALAIERQGKAWDLYIAGQTQAQIATVLGVTRQAVAKMLDRAQKAAGERMSAIVEKVKVRDLDRLEHIISEAMRAWHRSKRTRVKETVKTDEDGSSLTVAKERTAGDARYLDVAVEAMERQAKMLGIDAPKTVSVNCDRPLSNLTEDELRRELMEINASLGVALTEDTPTGGKPH